MATNSGIWNPADVHVKTESSTSVKVSDVISMTSPLKQHGEEQVSQHSPVDETCDETREDEENDQNDDEMSEGEEEHVDVENVKDDKAMEESGESESDPDEDAR